MKTTTLAAASLALAGVLLADQNAALAKGPLGIEGQSSLLILAKETQHTDIDFKDFPFGLEEGRTENVRLMFEQEIASPEGDEKATIKYVMTMPWLEVEKNGDDEVTVTFAEQQTAVVNIDGPDDENVTFTADMTHEDTVMTFKRDGDRMTYEGSSKAFAAVVKTPEEIADKIVLDYTISGKDMKIEGSGAAEQDYADLETLDISYDYTIGSIAFAFDIENKDPDEEMPPISMTGESGELAASGKIGDGVLTGSGIMNDMAIKLMKPMPMELFFGKFATDMTMPTDASDEPQRVHYLIEAEEIQIDEALWAMADPGKAFPARTEQGDHRSGNDGDDDRISVRSRSDGDGGTIWYAADDADERADQFHRLRRPRPECRRVRQG